jgi:hypothetical protein
VLDDQEDSLVHEQAGESAARPTQGCRECHAQQPYTVEDFSNGSTGWRCVVCGHILPLMAEKSINDADGLAVSAEDVDDQSRYTAAPCPCGMGSNLSHRASVSHSMAP